MAIRIFDKYGPTRANAPTTDYPAGSVKNESVPGANDGTPLDEEWGNDYAGFDAALFAEASITPDNNPDTAQSSQRLEALRFVTGNRSGLTFDSVADMITGAGKVDWSASTVGTACTTGATTWRQTSFSSPMTESDFELLSERYANDYSLDNSGTSDVTATLNDIPNGAIILDGVYRVDSDVSPGKWFVIGGNNVVITGLGRSSVSTKLKDGLFTKNLYLATFFTDTNFAKRPVGIHTSEDGEKFKHIVEIDRDSTGTKGSYGDPCIFYKRGKFYIAYTEYVTDVSDVSFLISSNLVDFEKRTATLGPTPIHKTNGTAPGWTYQFPSGPFIWAPEWFEDDDEKIYLTVSIQCDQNRPTVVGNEFYFRQYLCECTDLENLTFTSPVEIEIDGKKGPAQCGDQDNVIDACFIRLGANYIMGIKNEYEKTIFVCSSPSITGNFTTIKTNVFEDLTRAGDISYTEAPSITTRYDPAGVKSFRFYADKYTDKNTYYVDTSDFLTYTPSVSIENQSYARHGTVINVCDLPASDFSNIVSSIKYADSLTGIPLRSDIVAYKNMKDLPGYPSISLSNVENATLYRITYEEAPVNSFIEITSLPDDASANDGAFFFIGFFSGNEVRNARPRGITFSQGCSNLIPNTKKTYITQNAGNSDLIYKVTKTESAWRIQQVSLDLSGNNNFEQTLTGLTNFPEINNGNDAWWPNANSVYYSTGADPTAINIWSIPTDYPDGTVFYLQARTNTANGTIVLKAGPHALWPSDISIGTSEDGILKTVRLVNGKWAIVS